MADQKCPVCGKKIGGVFWQPEPSGVLLERAKKFGSSGFSVGNPCQELAG